MTDSQTPVVANCGWCESEFTVKHGPQMGAFNAGRTVFCSTVCQQASGNSRRPHLVGPCPTCGKMFRSRTRGKKYCTMDCYIASDKLSQRLRKENDVKRVPATSCPQCGQDVAKRNTKYCSSDCRRMFFAARFDRWIADPQEIALPQNFDEFMLQDLLPCLVDGCDFVGEHLASHVNKAHGITADKFRELVGFNKKTGLVGRSLRKRMSDSMKAMIADGTVVSPTPDISKAIAATINQKPRLEAAEHHKKAMALMRSTGTSPPPLPCLQCGVDTPQPVAGKRKYCSIKCRSRYYQEQGSAELKCEFCGALFTAMLSQVKRAQQGKPVCCSTLCRNRMNIRAALAARGITYA